MCQAKFEIQDVDNYVERVDNFVDMSKKYWDKIRISIRKRKHVFDIRRWKMRKKQK